MRVRTSLALLDLHRFADRWWLSAGNVPRCKIGRLGVESGASQTEKPVVALDRRDRRDAANGGRVHGGVARRAAASGARDGVRGIFRADNATGGGAAGFRGDFGAQPGAAVD